MIEQVDVPDPAALRRRVLVTGVLTLGLFLVAAYFLTALSLSSAWLIPVLVLVFFLVVQPLMRPVRQATALRRRLAYQAFLDQRGDG